MVYRPVGSIDPSKRPFKKKHQIYCQSDWVAHTSRGKQNAILKHHSQKRECLFPKCECLCSVHALPACVTKKQQCFRFEIFCASSTGECCTLPQFLSTSIYVGKRKRPSKNANPSAPEESKGILLKYLGLLP